MQAVQRCLFPSGTLRGQSEFFRARFANGELPVPPFNDVKEQHFTRETYLRIHPNILVVFGALQIAVAGTGRKNNDISRADLNLLAAFDIVVTTS